MKGKVILTEGDPSGIAIQNTSTNRGTITDAAGLFSLRVKVGDTIVFSAIQLKRKIITIDQVIFQSNFISVPMEAFVNELDEVVLNPYNLSGNISADIVDLELEKNVSAEALELPNARKKIPTQTERKLQTATSFGNNLLKPSLDPIINAITGRTKRLKKHVKVDKTYKQTKKVQNYYVDSLFVSYLNIPVAKIDDFMYYCEVDTTFQNVVSTEDQLKIWDYMVLKSKAYRKDNSLE